ncbi:unnamed protein product [Sphagnum balticum]
MVNEKIATTTKELKDIQEQINRLKEKDHTKIFNPPLPFDVAVIVKGKESTFTVEYPDYIKEFKLHINVKQNRISQIVVVSNMGITAEFISEEPKELPKDPKDIKEAKSTKKEKKERPPTEETA